MSLKALYDAALANGLSKKPRRFHVTTNDGSSYEGIPTTGSGSDPNNGGPFVMRLDNGTKVRLTFDEVAESREVTSDPAPRSNAN